MKEIETIPGIHGVGKAVLLWIFDPKHAWIVLGIEQDNPVGPSILKNFVTEGRYFEPGKAEVMVEASYARQFGIRPRQSPGHRGQVISGGRAGGCLPCLEDRRGKYLHAHTGNAGHRGGITVPTDRLALCERRRQFTLYPDPGRSGTDRIDCTSDQGDPRSQDGRRHTGVVPEASGSLFALSDKFTLAASIIAMFIAVLIAFKTMAGNIAERAREIGVMKAVGWTQGNVVSQLLAESVVQCFAAGLLGLFIAQAAAFALGFMTVSIPIPWR